jgi:hypothetical protein
MLVANREDRVGPPTQHVGPAEPSRSLASRFTGSMQLVGSFIGIPLALLGGYSTYHSNFSTEAKCQSLRASIVSMLDKKADASTIRMLVQRDVMTFQRDCGEVDPDAVAAFRNLLAPERAQAARPVAPAPKSDAKPVKAEVPKAEPAPAQKPEAARVEAPKKVQPPPAAVKREAEKPIQEAKPQIRTEPKIESKTEPKPDPKPAEMTTAKQDPAQPEPKAAEVSSPAGAESEQADSAWIASVRDALRESALRPVAAPASEMANPMPPPIDIAAPPSARREARPIAEVNAPPRPPADLAAPPEPRQEARPVPPAAIPGADPVPSEN